MRIPKPDSLEMRSHGNVRPDLACDVGEALEGGCGALVQGLFAPDSEECRRLAEWFTAAADWMDQQHNREGR